MASRAVTLQFLGEAGQLKTTLAGVQRDLVKTGGAVGALAKTGKGLSVLGQAITRYVSLPLGLAAAAAVDLALKYDSAMNKVAAITTANKADMKLWYQGVLDLAKTVPVGPEQLANALYFVASSGFHGAKAMDILTASAKASTAGLGDTGDIAKTLDSVMNAYAGTSLTATQATDYMIAAISQGDMPSQDLASSIGQVLSIAAQAGVPFKDLAAAIAASSKQGINAQKTAQGLRFMLSRFISPTQAATKALGHYGITVGSLRSELKDKGLLPLLQDLKGKMSEADFAKVVGGARGLSVALALVGRNGKQVSDVFKGVNNGKGSLDKAFATAEQNPQVKLKTNLNALKVAGIELGNDLLPTVVKVVQWLAKIADKFSGLSPGMKQFIAKAVVVGIALGPILKILGSLFKVMAWGFRTVMTLAGWFGKLFEAGTALWEFMAPLVETLGEVFGAIAVGISPVGWVIIAVLALSAAFYVAYRYSGTFRKWVGEALSFVGNLALTVGKWFLGLGKAIAGGFMAGVQAVKPAWDAVMGVINSGVSAVGAVISAVIGFIIKVGRVIEPVAKIIGEILLIPLLVAIVIINKQLVLLHKFLSTVLPPVFRVLRSAWDFFYKAISSEISQLVAIFKSVFNAIKTIIKTTLDWVTSAWSAVWSAAQSVWSAFTSWISAAWNAFSGAVKTAWHAILGPLASAWNAVWSGAETLWVSFSAWIGGQWQAFSSGTSRIWSTITKPISAAWSVVWTGLTAVWTTIANFLRGIWSSTVSPILSALGTAISGVGSNIWNGLKSGFQGAINAIINAWDSFIKALKVPKISVGPVSFGGWTPAADLLIKPIKLANGGLFDKSTIAEIGEAGREVAIPLTRKSRALDLAARSGLTGMILSSLSGNGRQSGSPARGKAGVHIEHLEVKHYGGTSGDVASELAWKLRGLIPA